MKITDIDWFNSLTTSLGVALKFVVGVLIATLLITVIERMIHAWLQRRATTANTATNESCNTNSNGQTCQSSATPNSAPRSHAPQERTNRECLALPDDSHHNCIPHPFMKCYIDEYGELCFKRSKKHKTWKDMHND